MKTATRYECICAGAKHFPAVLPKDIEAFEAFVGLLETIDGIDTEMKRFLARFDLSQARFTVLMLIAAGLPEEKTPATLAEEAGISRSSMTELLDTLENAGLAARTANPQNRRSVRIHLTERGRILMEDLLPQWFHTVSEMVHLLSKAEQTALTYLLEKIRSAFSVFTEKRSRGDARGREPKTAPKTAHPVRRAPFKLPGAAVLVVLLFFLCSGECQAITPRSPTIDVFGSYFPDWMICILSGIALAAMTRLLLIALRLHTHIRPAVAIYPCMAAVYSFAAWLLFFLN